MTVFRHAARAGLLATAITLLASCDDDPTGGSGAIEISVNPATASVAQGEETFVTVTITRTGGFDGSVSLTVSNLPNGVSATLDPAELPAGTSTARVDLTATASAVPTSSIVTIAASSPNVQSVSTTVNLTVTTYSIGVAPASLTIPAGSSGVTSVNIDRQGFTGPVALQLIGAPAGVLGSFEPAAPTTAQSTLTLTVGTTVAPGNYALTVAELGLMPDRTASLQLVVVAAPGVSGNVEYRFCDATQAPVYLAYQDGAGAWQKVEPTVSGGATRFSFAISSGSGGVLAVYQNAAASVASRTPALRARSRYPSGRWAPNARAAAVGDVYSTVVVYGTTAELADDGAATCALTLPTRTVLANVSSINAGQYGVLSLGNVTEYFDGAVNQSPMEFTGVKGGPVDFVGSRIVQPGTPPDRVLVYRDLDPADGSTLSVPINFNTVDAFAPAVATATITSGNNDHLEVFNEVVTATSHVLIWSDLLPSTNASRPWIGLTPARMKSTDVHGLIVFASDVDAPGDFRVASKYVGPVANQTIAMGATVDAATVSTLVAGNYPRYRFQGVVPAEYNKGIAISILAEDAGNDVLLMAARGYLAAAGNAQAYDLSMPDALLLPGFPAGARLTAGANVVATDAFGFTGAGVFDSRPVIGSEFRGSVRVAPLVVP